MIRKILSVLLAAILILTASACGGPSQDKTSGTESQTEKEASSSTENTKEMETSSEEQKNSEAETSKEDATESSPDQTEENTSESTSAQPETSSEADTETPAESSSEEDPTVYLHLDDGILLKYFIGQEMLYLVAVKSQTVDAQTGLPYQLFNLVDLSPEMNEELRSLQSGTSLQLTYILAAEGDYPLPVMPVDIVALDKEPECDQTLLRSVAELGFFTLMDCETYPTFLLVMPLAKWAGYPVSYEYSEDGRTFNVYYELKRDNEDAPVKFTLITYALSTSGDEPGGDIGYANARLREDGADYLYMGLPRYAYDYIADHHDFYFYPEEGNWDNEIKVTLTDEELKQLILLQTGFDNTIDYDALREKYLKAVEADDTDAITEAYRPLFKADEFFAKFAEDNVSINGLKPVP